MGTVLDPLLLRVVLTGLGIALLTGPFGAVLVWRRLAYFGDSLAHSALLGVALALALDIAPILGTALACAVVALSLSGLAERGRLAGDTLLGILSHAALALGLIAIALHGGAGAEVLMGYLFGDVLTVTGREIWLIYGGGGLLLAGLAWIWRGLLSLSVDAELAAIDGVPVRRIRTLYMLMVALVIAIGMKAVGALLITAMLIIPAAAARQFARSPEAMAMLAGLAGCLAVLLGLWGSFRYDLPAGPAVVAAAFALFLLASLAARWRRGQETAP